MKVVKSEKVARNRAAVVINHVGKPGPVSAGMQLTGLE